MAQLVARILGKDEVTGSNPVSSSRVPSLTVRAFCFCGKEKAEGAWLSALLMIGSIERGLLFQAEQCEDGMEQADKEAAEALVRFAAIFAAAALLRLILL